MTAQRMEVPKRDQRLRLDSLTKIQPGKITQRLFSRREHTLRGFGVNGRWHRDESEFAGGSQTILLPVMTTISKASDLAGDLGHEMVAEQP